MLCHGLDAVFLGVRNGATQGGADRIILHIGPRTAPVVHLPQILTVNDAVRLKRALDLALKCTRNAPYPHLQHVAQDRRN